MRKAMYIIAGLVILLIAFQIYTTMSTKGTPQQPYSVLKTIGDMEVRRYPEALTATVIRPGGTYKEISSAGFRSLAGYIFGGNEGGKKIAMTAPVHMEMGGDSSRMSFVMPEDLTMDSPSLPQGLRFGTLRLHDILIATFRTCQFGNSNEQMERSSFAPSRAGPGYR